MLETKVDDSLHVQFNQLHKPVMSEISLYASRYCVTSSLRKTEIMGEAINRIRKKDPTFEIPNAKEVINTRNRIM